jgi:hypothetical protein
MVLFIITGTVTFPFGIQVDHSDHFRFLIALGKNDPHLLRISRTAFQRIPGAARILQV